MLLCGVIPMVMIFERIPNRLEWYGDAEMCWRLEGRLNSAAIFFFFQESHLLLQTLVGRRENVIFGGVMVPWVD